MPTTDTVVIGAGHAGLAVSRCLTDAGVDHVVLDRGRVAERWRSERWDSLRLLTPNWMTRLPGWSLHRARPGRLHDRRRGRQLPRGLRRRRSAPRSIGDGPVTPPSRPAMTASTSSRPTRPGGPPTSWSRPAGATSRPCRPGRPARPDRSPRSHRGRTATRPAARRRRARRRRLRLRRAARRRARPGRARRGARRRPAHPDAPPLPRDGHLLVAGAHRHVSTAPSTTLPDPARRPPRAVAAAGRPPRPPTTSTWPPCSSSGVELTGRLSGIDGHHVRFADDLAGHRRPEPTLGCAASSTRSTTTSTPPASTAEVLDPEPAAPLAVGDRTRARSTCAARGHHHGHLGHRLPPHLPVAAGARPRPRRRDPPTPRRHPRPRPVRGRAALPAPPRLELHRRRRRTTPPSSPTTWSAAPHPCHRQLPNGAPSDAPRPPPATTSSSSAPAPPAPPPPCCWPAPGCACSSSTAAATAPTPCRPTPSCAAASSSCTAGACSTASSTPARQPIRRTTFRYADDDITVAIKPAHGVDALYAPRRTVLDPVLVDAAVAAGAEVRYGVTVTDVRRDRRPGRGHRRRGRDDTGRPFAVDAGIVIGADGLRSTVAERVGAPVEHAGTAAGAVVYGYWAGHRHRRLRVGLPARVRRRAHPHQRRADLRLRRQHAGPHRPGRTPDARRRRPPARHPPSPSASPPAPPPPACARFAGRPGYLRRAWGPGWALVGDAGSWKDPISAHGLTDALRDAELLARAILDRQWRPQRARRARRLPIHP